MIAKDPPGLSFGIRNSRQFAVPIKLVLTTRSYNSESKFAALMYSQVPAFNMTKSRAGSFSNRSEQSIRSAVSKQRI